MTDSHIHVIFTCSCPGTPSRAKTAYRLLHPNKPTPPVLSSKQARQEYVEDLPSSPAKTYLSQYVEKRHKRFAFLFVIKDTPPAPLVVDRITNLLTGETTNL